MKRYFAVVALVCALAGGLRAQNTSTFGNIVSQGTPCGASNCVYYQLPVGTPWVNVTVTGSWSGTLEIAATYAPNANYSNLSTIAWTALATETGNGTWSASTGGAAYNGTWNAAAGGAVYLRVRATSWATGTAQVTMNSAQSPTNNPILPGQLTATELVAHDAAVGGIKLLCIATSNNGSAYRCDTTPIYTPVTTETTIELLPDVASNAGEVTLSVNGSSPFDISTVGTATGPVTDPGAGVLKPLTPVFLTLQFATSGFFFYWTAPELASGGGGGETITPGTIPVSGPSGSYVDSILQQSGVDSGGMTVCDQSTGATKILCEVSRQSGTFDDLGFQISNTYPMFGNNVTAYTWSAAGGGTLTVTVSPAMTDLAYDIAKVGAQGVVFEGCAGSLEPLNIQNLAVIGEESLGGPPIPFGVSNVGSGATQFQIAGINTTYGLTGFSPPSSGTDSTCQFNMYPLVEAVAFSDNTHGGSETNLGFGGSLGMTLEYDVAGALGPGLFAALSIPNSFNNDSLLWCDGFNDNCYQEGDYNIETPTYSYGHPSALVTTNGAGWVGPVTAPTGSCSRNGATQISQDGKITQCDSGTETAVAPIPAIGCDASKVPLYGQAVCVFTLTSAQILAFDGTSATAVQAIAAPGAGRAIQYNSAISAFEYLSATTPYSADITLNTSWASVFSAMLNVGLPTSQSTDQIALGQSSGGTDNQPASVVNNSALSIFCGTNCPVTSGDGTIVMTIFFTVVPVR